MSAKINQPSPQIFSSDPLEQIFGKSVMDPTMGGLAYMFMNALGDRRRMDQDTYMQGVSESNQIAGRVAMQEAEAKHQQELLKGALKMAEMGQPGSTMPILQSIIQSGALDQGTDMNRELIRATIINKMRDPSGGDGGVKFEANVTPGGSGGVKISGKGPNAQQAVNDASKQQLDWFKNNGILFDDRSTQIDPTAKYQR